MRVQGRMRVGEFMGRFTERSAGYTALLSVLGLSFVLGGCVKEKQVTESESQPLAAENKVTSKASAAPVQLNNEISLRDSDPLIDRLVLAARYGQQESVLQLLAQGAQINGKDVYGNTALVAAAANGQMEMVDLLVLKGAAVDLPNADAMTPLMGAAAKGAYNLVHTLIQLGAKVDARDKLGETALFKAVQYGHLTTVKVLLRAGADPNLHNTRPVNVAESGYTPLMYAVTNGLVSAPVDWPAITQVLLDNGADPELVDAQGETALSLAKRLNNKAIVAVLKRSGAKENMSYAALDNDEALIRAVRLGDTRKIDELLRNGASVNYVDRNGVTPLLAASFEGQLEVVKQLLSLGAEINYVTSGLTQYALAKSRAPLKERELIAAAARGDTALIAAGRQGHYDIVTYLLDHGAVIDRANRKGETALFAAIAGGDMKLVELLLAHGADANEREQENRFDRIAAARQSMGRHSALTYAVSKGRYGIAEALIDAGADIDYRASMGKTALFLAAESGQTRLAELLLAKGADVNIASSTGLTALMEAAKKGNVALAQSLLLKGSRVNAIERPDLGYGARRQAGSDMTALMYAARNGHEEVVRLLLRSGAIATIHNADGKTALDEAENNGYTEVVKLLQGDPGSRVAATLISQ